MIYKKKLILILCLVLSAFSVFGIVGCDDKNTTWTGFNYYAGTYYKYVNGIIDENSWITLEDKKWSDSDKMSGRLEYKNNTVYCYAELLGKEEMTFFGTVTNGMFRWTVDESEPYNRYFKIGAYRAEIDHDNSTEDNENPRTEHTHRWATTLSKDGAKHWYACSGCSEKKEEKAHSYQNGVCVCGQKEPQPEHTHQWASTLTKGTMTHWYACNGCSEKKEEKAHGYQGGICECGAKQLFTVTFESNDGSEVPPIQVEAGDMIKKMPIPTKEGYTFAGWYKDAECTVPWIFEKDVVSAGVTVYTKWEKDKGAITVPTKPEVSGGEFVAPSITVPGYEFDAYYTDDTFTEKATPDKGADGTTLYAKWTPKQYTVTLDADGGESTGTTFKVTYDGTFTLPVPVCGDDIFIGWYIGEVQITDADGNSLEVWKIEVNVSITIVAKYERHIHDWKTEWSINGTKHWHACNGCNQIKDEDTHSYTDGVCVCGKEKQKATEGLAYSLNTDGESYTVVGIGKATDTDIVIPSEYEGKPVKRIGDVAFLDCVNLTSIEIPDSVTNIGRGAFAGCSKLEAVYISDIAKWCEIKFYDEWSSGVPDEWYLPILLFANPLCYAHNLYLNGELVTRLIIPESVTNIGNAAFTGCNSLTSVEIPNGVTSIGEYTFWGCSNLTSIEIPNSVTNIGWGAFAGCSKLEAVYISDIAKWCEIKFYDEWSSGVPNEMYLFANPLCYAHNLYLNGELVTSLIIPESVTNIGNAAFVCCSLTSVEIPNGVTSIGGCAFDNCKNLTRIDFKGTKEEWSNLHWNWIGTGYTVYCEDGTVSTHEE